MQFPEFIGKKIAILWYGREGKSTLNFLLKHGVDKNQITILDKNGVEEEWISIISGDSYLQNLDHYDLIFKTAGMPYFPEIQQVIDNVTTQVQFFFDHFEGKIIAITASKGKTTMTSLAYQLLLDANYPVILAGNIGKPVLDQIDFDDTESYVVIELSSFMLETLKKTNLISILGSIFPVHLDWHQTMENYVKAKGNILKGSMTNIMFSSTKEQFFPTLSEDNLIVCWKGTDYTWDSDFFYVREEKLFSLSDIKLLWEHNVWNISAIVALAETLNIPKDILIQTLISFNAVRHRLEKVWTFKGIDFYDDAISTSPFSTIAALDALGDTIDTLFLWWVDGWYNFDAMIDKIKKSQIRNLVLFPDSGERIEQLLWDHSYNILHTREMKEGVDFAYQYTTPWKIALLSTATPSFSLWKNFEEKGDLFQEWVKKLA